MQNANLEMIDRAFREIQDQQNIEGNLALISNCLKREFDLNVNVTLVNNKSAMNFFGVSMYPDKDQLDTLVQKLTYNDRRDALVSEWSQIKNWELELDSLLIYNNQVNPKPYELTAVVLHEIGRIVYSNIIPYRAHKAWTKVIQPRGYVIRKLSRWKNAIPLIRLVYIHMIGEKNFTYSTEDSEVDADKFAFKMGYGDKLNALIDRMLAKNGSDGIAVPANKIETADIATVLWIVESIEQLEYRKTGLKDLMKNELMTNPSAYVRACIVDIRNQFFGDSKLDARTTRGIAAMEFAYLDAHYAEIVKESAVGFFDKLGNGKEVNQYDIDQVFVETDRIVDEDDKIYVLDRIVILNERLDSTIRTAQKHPNKIKTPMIRLQQYQKELGELRSKVLHMKISPKRYGIFIKYPRGYEG